MPQIFIFIFNAIQFYKINSDSLVILLLQNVVKVWSNFHYIYVSESEFSVKTKIIAADFTKGAAAINRVKEELGSLPIGILGKHTYITSIA